MSQIKYIDWRPSKKSLEIIDLANSICTQYAQQGYDLTLRQLYYQFISRDFFPNNERSYKNLGSIVDKARKAGLMDWGYIVDRTRNLAGYPTYDNPSDFITKMTDKFHIDVWDHQPNRIEVWVEKEALAGVVQRAASSRQVNYFCCRGYVSQSEMHAAAQRFKQYNNYRGQSVHVIYLGDHDPSGIDMDRDIADRLNLFDAADVTVHRIALNMDQIIQYSPPPNYAKQTDSRARKYIREYGGDSWELDALEPGVLVGLITDKIDSLCDRHLFANSLDAQNEQLRELSDLAEQWDVIRDQFSLGR